MTWLRDLPDYIDRMYNAIEHAKAVGTYGAMDRSRQYDDDDPKKLRNAVNEAWTEIRVGKKAATAKDKEIEDLKKALGNYKIANIALTAVLTGLAWEGLKAVVAYLPHLLK